MSEVPASNRDGLAGPAASSYAAHQPYRSCCAWRRRLESHCWVTIENARTRSYAFCGLFDAAERSVTTFPAAIPFLVFAACSSDSAPVTVAPRGVGGVSGAASGAGGSMVASTSGTGGASSAGAATGGSAGSGGRAVGGAGGTGGSAGSGGQPDLVDTLATTPNDFGVALADSWFLTPCFQKLTFNCLTVSSANADRYPNCPGAQNKFEESGAVFLETFKLGGDAATLYDITSG